MIHGRGCICCLSRRAGRGAGERPGHGCAQIHRNLQDLGSGKSGRNGQPSPREGGSRTPIRLHSWLPTVLPRVGGGCVQPRVVVSLREVAGKLTNFERTNLSSIPVVSDGAAISYLGISCRKAMCTRRVPLFGDTAASLAAARDGKLRAESLAAARDRQVHQRTMILGDHERLPVREPPHAWKSHAIYQYAHGVHFYSQGCRAKFPGSRAQSQVCPASLLSLTMCRLARLSTHTDRIGHCRASI